MTQPPDDAALVARLKALLARRRDAGDAYDRLLAEVQGEPLEEDEDDDRGLRRGHAAVMVASSLLSHASVEALPGLLDALEAKDREIAKLHAGFRGRIDAGLRAFCADTPDFDMSPGMRRIAADFIMGQPFSQEASRAALEPSDKGVGR